MSTREPGRGDAPDGQDPVHDLPDDLWDRFLRECAHPHGGTAPTEPSARARTGGARVRPPSGPGPKALRQSVGDLWEPQETPVAAWRDLDGPARRRRVGRVCGTAVAVTLLLALWSGAPVDRPDASGTSADATPRQSEVAPPAPRATGPVGLPSPDGSATAPQPD
ncbi:MULTISPECIES: hypothetical protein [unclassified Streptomyces]|uniref:hypothetical protein n=1 Tax=unclassified Streptomyces TaxID=2593676 RepID=UPI001F03E3C5|nr:MULTISPECIES: hypothetical protein [unclassified Streptomyces]MCH0564510.1 hypothetical protein [Streptomyces sp. MUM 2J]MCH0572870.1 hypothetical protein [Streptomyces sp. MUM 136J]